jgi:hypothetical protein
VNQELNLSVCEHGTYGKIAFQLIRESWFVEKKASINAYLEENEIFSYLRYLSSVRGVEDFT